MQTLVAVVILDYITGISAAWVTKTLDSGIGHKGIIRKVSFFILVAVAQMIDQGWSLQGLLCTTVVWFLIATEALSITENLAEIGVPIPPVLINKLKQLRKKGEEDA